MSAELAIRDLEKVFPTGKPAVDGVSFTITPGEIVVLLGPSGCGKTTTLRCVAGLEHPTAGEISLDGDLVSAPAKGILTPPRARNIGMVFQSYAVWPHMTVRQNVTYPLRTRGMTRAAMDKAVRDALDLVDLVAYADRPVTQLSGGQMQRVALARSMVYAPRLLLLDEPLSNLDAQLRLRLRDDLRRIIKRTGLTALYVTHDQQEAVVLGDRIGVMQGGKLRQMATPAEIYNRPADQFVAEFTGASSMLPCRLARRDGAFGTVEMADGSTVEAWMPATPAIGTAMVLAIRPENALLGAAGGSNHFTAKVHALRYQGTQTIYELDALGGRIEALELGTAARHPQGSEVSLTLPPALTWAYAVPL